jgi:hypothetical protein
MVNLLPEFQKNLLIIWVLLQTGTLNKVFLVLDSLAILHLYMLCLDFYQTDLFAEK